MPILEGFNFCGFNFYLIQAMWLGAEMCQYYRITDVQPWAVLLKQMYTLGMVSVKSYLQCYDECMV